MEMFDCVSHPNKEFSYCRDGGCRILTAMLCKTGVCKFYKNAKMLEEQQKKCSERIKRLVESGVNIPTYSKNEA